MVQKGTPHGEFRIKMTDIKFTKKRNLDPREVFIKFLFAGAYKWLARRNMTKCPQLGIYAFDFIAMEILKDGRYEANVLEDTFDFLSKRSLSFSGTALDIGANIGNHSVYFLKHFKSVHSFEPNPKVASMLRLNADGRSISVYEFGLSNKNTSLTFAQNEGNLGSSFICEDDYDKSSRLTKIEVRRLDDLNDADFEKVSLMKIDVEGHELQVLEGAELLISKDRPIILFEQGSSDFIAGASAVTLFLKNKGYKFYIRDWNFNFGQRGGKKYLGTILRVIFGERVTFREVTIFEPKQYNLIVALPN
jgi:FkbM family methyltransferase